MPLNGYNVGKDVLLDIIGPQGPIRFNITTGFEAKPKYKSIEVLGLDGINRHGELPVGWTGSMQIDRADSQVDDTFAKMEEAYYNGQNLPAMTITQTISEVSGAITQYRFTGVVLKLEEAGNWQGDAKVTQKMSFSASRRIKVA